MSAERQLIDHYAAVRRRCYGTPPPKPDAYKPPPVLITFNLGEREGWQRIMDEVCAKHRIGPAEIMEKAHQSHHRVRHVRWEIWWRIRHELTVPHNRRPTMTEIGKWFHRDHSTVSYGVANHAALLARLSNDHV